jgi:thiol-disulfide isomerase/thioredoxin
MAAGQSLRQPDLTNTVWDAVDLNPATLADLRRWFVTMAEVLVHGDTLLVFVTDHGTRNKDDPDNGFIMLWNESLSVLEFRALLGHLRPGVRIVSVMSQCFSGGFAAAIAPFYDSTPSGDVCGFYSTTADRPAYGCYPEGRDRDRIGHAFRFIDALRRQSTLDTAHREVLLNDSTPDVPLRSSDLYLESLLERDAERRNIDVEQFVDELLREAWTDRGRWEPELRLLDMLGSVYGTFSPRNLTEFREHIGDLRALSEELDTYGDRWAMVLHDLRQDNFEQFLRAQPSWSPRLASNELKNLEAAERQELLEELFADLEPFIRSRGDAWDRLHELRATVRDAKDAEFRVETRLAALLRMRAVLVRVAGKRWLEDTRAELDAARLALTRLEACEASPIGTPDGIGDAEDPVFSRMRPFEEDLQVVERVLPSWFGIRFRPVRDERRDQLDLARGAVLVQHVFDDSGAGVAGIRPGDIVLGPPGQPFDEPRRIREWIMRSPRETPLRLELLRENDRLEVTVSLGPYPTELPRLPAPPGVGDDAPVLPALMHLSDADVEPQLAGRRHLLFFWATWCGPCKASVPELLAWSESTQVPILAVSDEYVPKIRRFLEQRAEPFPDLVASDEGRLSYVSYGVSGTPTFILIDETGKIEWRQVGYSIAKGLGIEGWNGK